MNVINKAFLKLALLPSPLYDRFGVNTTQLKSILYTKLTIDDRRPNTMHQTASKKPNKPITRATIGTMVISALMGLLYLFAFAIGSDVITHLVFYFTMFFVMLSATLVSDFTSVLIDIRDNYIILPKPVTDRTFIVARLLHIFIHICKLVLPMALPGMILVGIEFGFGGFLLFLLQVMMVTVFTIFFINAVYIIILRITTPQKFQSVISYVQVIFAIVIYASYQFFPRMVDSMDLENFSVMSKPWIIYYPLHWIAATWPVIFEGASSQIIPAVLGILLPFISLFIVVRYLAPSFNNKLALINTSSTESPKEKKSVIQKRKISYPDFLSRLFTRSQTERMGFLFAWKMSSRSRDFRLKVYPSIGYLLVYVVVVLFRGSEINLEDIQNEKSSGRFMIISALYFTSFVLIMAINQIVYSDKFKAAWIFYVTPLKNPGEVILGSAKAAILKFYIPIVVIITIVGFALVGIRIMPNIILGLFNELLIVTMVVYVGKKLFPFSLQQNTNLKAGSFMRNLLVLGISMIIGIVHFLLYPFTYVIIILALLSIGATWLMMSGIKNASWASIKSTYEDQ